MSRPRAIDSLFWSWLDTIGSFIVGIVSVLIIARLIGEEAFGLGAIALGMVLIFFVAVGSVVHDALVRQHDIAVEDFDTGFSASLLGALLSVFVLGLLAPTVGSLMDEPRLPVLIWAFLPLLVLTGLATPLMAARRRALDFKIVGRCQLIGRLVGMGVGLGAALSGAGVWSLVAQHLSAAAYLAATMLWLAPRWPCLRLSWRRLRPMLRFCGPIVISQMLSQGTGRLFIVGMGYWHGLAAAGHWGVATRLSESLIGAATQATYNVALAYMARMQGSRRRLLAALERAQSFLMFVAVPVLAALAAGAEPLIRLLLGSNWSPTASLLWASLPGAVVLLRQMLMVTALRAVGQSSVSIVSATVTLTTAAAALLAVGSFAPLTIALVAGLSPFAGYAAVTVMLQREFGRPVVREAVALARDLACGGAAIFLGRGMVALLPDRGALLEMAVAASGGFLAALAFLVLLQPKMARRGLQHVRSRPRAAAGWRLGISSRLSAFNGPVLRRRGS